MMAFYKKNQKVIIYLALSAIVLVGLFYRVRMALHIQYAIQYEGTPYTHDEYHYLEMTKNLLAGRGYGYWGGRDAYVTPGYPLLMTAVMAVFGAGDDGILAMKLVQVAMSAACVLFVFLLCVKLTKSRGAGLIAAMFVSFYPPLILYARHLLTETPYIFFLLLYFNIQLWVFRKKAPLHAAAGALFGITILIRPMIAVLLPLPYIVAFIMDKNRDERRKVLKSFGYFALAVIMVMLPWWVRNIMVLHKFVLFATQANPFYAGVVRDYGNLPPSSNQFADGIKLLFHKLATEPLTTIKWFTIGKIDLLFSKPAYSLPAGVTYLISIASPIHIHLVSLGSLGTLAGLFDKRLRLLSLYTLFYIALSLLFIPTSRFGLQYMPLFAVYAAYIIQRVFGAPAHVE